MTTTTDHEVLDDLADFEAEFENVPADPVDRHSDPMALLAPSVITIPPSDLPAAELPDYEPTVADLLAIESFGDAEIDARISSANTLSAYEARHRDLLRLRTELGVITGWLDISSTVEELLEELDEIRGCAA